MLLASAGRGLGDAPRINTCLFTPHRASLTVFTPLESNPHLFELLPLMAYPLYGCTRAVHTHIRSATRWSSLPYKFP